MTGWLFESLARRVGRLEPEPVAAVGPRLTRSGVGAWLADRELDTGRWRLPIRMVVLEHAPGRLSLYSPVLLDDATLEALLGLGEVDQIIMPNRFHTLFVDAALERFPQASLLAPPSDAGVARRHGERVRHVTEPGALGTRSQIYPVRLRSGLEELVVYHDPAELLVVADLLFNFQHAEGALRWLLRANGVWRRPAISRMQRLLLLKDRTALAGFYRWAMSRPFSRISMSHGEPLTSEAREVFYRQFQPFSSSSPGASRMR